MGRVKKKPTMVRSLSVGVIIFCIFTLVGATILLAYTTHLAVQDTAREILARESRQILPELQAGEDGRVTMNPGAANASGECWYAVVGGDGEIIASDFPGEVEALFTRPCGRDGTYQQIKVGGSNYISYDHMVRLLYDEKGGAPIHLDGDGKSGLFIRTMIDTDHLHTVYRNIQYIYLGIFLLLVAILAVGSVWMYRRAARPVDEMCEKAEHIIVDRDLSDRIEDTGIFYETEIMSDAYNKLLDRTRRLAMQQEAFNESVSHELRTPVALIRSECELMEDLYHDELPAEVAESVAVIHKQSDRMNAMIEELLYLARIDRETYELHMEPMDLVDLAESVCEDAEDLMDGRWKFVYDLQPAVAEIDVALIIIAMRNLISNAMKYSPQDSRIGIATGTREDMAFLRVRDEGIGISQEERDKIFRPYYQARGERNSDGFGLGLALVKKTVDKHNGYIQLDSSPGQGSTFTMFLPVKQQKEER